MSSDLTADRLLVARVRAGEADAWNDLIARYEGRLVAFVEGRLGRRAAAEDIVQETLLGFLNSLPNYDESRSLEGYLFSIAAHKLTDYLRREGRRPALSLTCGEDEEDREVPASDRAVSSVARSGERRSIEERALAEAMTDEIARFVKTDQWQKLQCVELLFVRGAANKDVAQRLGMSEQVVANYKFDFLSRLRALVRKQELSEDLFPELRAE